MALVHGAEPERVGHVAQRRTFGGLYGDAVLVAVQRPYQLGPGGLQLAAGYPLLEVGMAGIPRRIDLVGELVERSGQVRRRGGPNGERGVEAAEVLGKGLGRVHQRVFGPGDPVGGEQGAPELAGQLVATGLEYVVGLHPLGLGQAGGVLLETALAPQQLVNGHIEPQRLQALGVEEGGQPAHRAAGVVLVRPAVKALEVVLGGAALVVEREVDEQLGRVPTGPQRRVGYLAGVAQVPEGDVELACRAPPRHLQRHGGVGPQPVPEVGVEQVAELAATGAGVVERPDGVLHDGFGVHVDQRDGHGGVDRVVTDAQLADVGAPVTQLLGNDLGFPAGNGAADTAPVEGDEPAGVEVAEGVDPVDQRGEQHGLDQPVVVAERPPHRVLLPARRRGVGQGVLAEQQRPQLGAVELLGVGERLAHLFRERFVPRRDNVPQITHGDELAEGELVALVHEELRHHLQRGAFALQRLGHRDERLHHHRAEGVHLAE